MKRIKIMAGIILICIASTISAATVNGRFSIVNVTSTKVSILLQINTNTGIDDLGGATIVFSFDTASISYPSNPVKNVDYIYHNFCGGNYSAATITRPIRNNIWVNIDLPFWNNNNGTIVAGNPNWTDVVTVHFNIVDPNGSAILTWLKTSPFWGIYDADNSTLWQNGNFQDLNGPLPVELVSFSALLLSDNKVLLEWKTASSINNFGFEVQKSYVNSNQWQIIGFVANQGNSNALVEYQFVDETEHTYLIVKYRLKIIDNDGSYQYSNAIEIQISPLTFTLSQNYPNPFNPGTKIKFTIPYTDKSDYAFIRLKVYDLLGNEVATLVEEEKKPGVYEVEFINNSLASGMYVYRIESEKFTETKKMILLR